VLCPLDSSLQLLLIFTQFADPIDDLVVLLMTPSQMYQDFPTTVQASPVQETVQMSAVFMSGSEVLEHRFVFGSSGPHFQTGATDLALPDRYFSS
jgi:hypothetical protein